MTGKLDAAVPNPMHLSPGNMELDRGGFGEVVSEAGEELI